MWRATSNLSRAAGVLLLASACLLWAPPGALSAPPASAADNASLAPSADNSTLPGVAVDPAREKARRAVWRKVAAASLCIILLLIIFIVFVMIYSRRMRIRHLQQYRRITFNKMTDVWWQKPPEKPSEKSDPKGPPRIS